MACRRAPWRSSRAGTCRPKVRRDRPRRRVRRFLQIAAWEVGVFEQHVLDLLSYLPDRVQGRARALEDHGHFTPAQFAQRFRPRRQQVDAAHCNAAAGDLGRLIVETHDGVGGDGFARSTFTDHAYDLAARDRQGYAFQCPHHAVTGAELHRQIVDLELRHHTRFLGSRRSRSPSPSMLKQNTASTRAAPGNMKAHHSPEMMKLAPSDTMMPHSGVGGRTPSPMNDRPAAFRIAHPMFSEACTIIGGRMFGTMWFSRTIRDPLPPMRAAST